MALTGLAKWLSDRYSSKIGIPLGWVDANWDLLVDDTLEMLGIDDEADEEPFKIHKVAIYVMWDKVKSDIALDFNYSADGGSYHIGDVDVDDEVNKAWMQASPYLDVYDVSVDWGETTSPYIYTEERDNAGNI